MTSDLQVFGINLAAAIRDEGGHGVFTSDGADLEAIRIANGVTVAWRPPAGAEPQHAEVDLAARAIRAVSGAANRAKAVDDDQMRSELAKQRDSAAAWLDADRALGIIEAEARRDLAEFDAAMHTAFDPPALAPSDAVGVAHDREVRDWVRSLGVDELAKLVTEMQAGEHSRTLVALVRSPTPLPPGMLAHAVPQLWIERVRKINPNAVLIESRKGRLEWIETILRQTRDALPRARGASISHAA